MNEIELNQIVRQLGSDFRLETSRELSGGSSAKMLLLEVIDGNNRHHKFILRWHGESDKDDYPQIVKREFHLLTELRRNNLPVAKIIYFDDSHSIGATSYLVLAYIDGHTDFSQTQVHHKIAQVAIMLANIHQATIPLNICAMLPSRESDLSNRLSAIPEQMDNSLREADIRDVLSRYFPWKTKNNDCLLHGDYWVGNWIWHNKSLVGIIDWEDASWGDPLSDLAIARLDILWAFGIDAMEQFTDSYRQRMPNLDVSHLPLWDLVSALRPMHQLASWASGWTDYGREDVTFHTMQRDHQWFVEQALINL